MNKINKSIYWNKIGFLETFFNNQLLINRKKIHELIYKKIPFDENKDILYIGTTPEIKLPHNYLIHDLKNYKRISCLSNQDCSNLKKICKNLKVIKEDGRRTSLKDLSFDIVYSSATIEHVGSKNDQVKFIDECNRLARKNVVITTPNRYFPLDFHTKIPFLHFFPKKFHRFVLKYLGFKFFAKEKNLNLLSKKNLIEICESLNIKEFKIYIHKFLGLSSNLILVINKK